MNRKLIALLTIILSLTLAASAFSQNPPALSAVKSPGGLIVKGNNPAQPFTLMIAGKRLVSRQTASGQLKITADGKPYTIYLVKTSNTVDLSKKPNTEEILSINKEANIWLQASKLTGAIRTTAQGVDSIQTADSSTASGASALLTSVYWSTLNETTGEKKFFQTAVLGDSILTVEIALGKTERIENVHSSAKRIMSSLKI
jgi:hypothetical protein